jgi:hypothetical protein
MAIADCGRGAEFEGLLKLFTFDILRLSAPGSLR